MRRLRKTRKRLAWRRRVRNWSTGHLSRWRASPSIETGIPTTTERAGGTTLLVVFSAFSRGGDCEIRFPSTAPPGDGRRSTGRSPCLRPPYVRRRFLRGLGNLPKSPCGYCYGGGLEKPVAISILARHGRDAQLRSTLAQYCGARNWASASPPIVTAPFEGRTWTEVLESEPSLFPSTRGRESPPPSLESAERWTAEFLHHQGGSTIAEWFLTSPAPKALASRSSL